METQELRDLVTQNRELEQQLTKRNQQYIFDLRKIMNLANVTEEKKVQAIGEMLPELIEAQKNGQTARQLYGTVSEKSESILSAPEPSKEMSRGQLWLDNTLLLLAFLALITGLLPMINKTEIRPEQGGIFTVLAGAVIGGYAFYLIHKFVYSYDRPGADKSKKPGTFKSMFIIAGIILAWMFIYMSTAFIPKEINIVFEPVVYVVVGGLAFALRYFIRKKFNITGNMFMRY